MPPINTQGSRASLVTAVVVFTILFVTSAIFAIYFNVQLRSTQDAFDNYRKNYNGVVSDQAFASPDFTALQALKNDNSSGYGGSTVMDIALQQRNQLAQDITGTAAEPGTIDAANKSAAEAVSAAIAKLKASNVAVASHGLVPVINALSNTLTAQQGQLNDLKSQLAAANQRAVDSEKALAEHDAARDKQIADIRAAAQAEEQKVNDQLNANQAIIASLQKQASDQATHDQASAQNMQMQMSERDRQLVQLRNQLSAYEARLGNRRPDVSNAAVTQPDGVIVRVPNDQVCYINLGQGDEISPGLTFEVYSAAEGVPPIPPNATGDEQLPVGKASIEVTRVGTSSSECRIVRVTPGAVLQEGDLIENLVYDPNTKYKFFVYGDFDLADTGKPNANDAQVVKRLITQWGGKLTDKINVDTDFVVLGKEPTVPEYSAEEMQQPLVADRVAKAQAAVDKYHELEQQAKDLHIPILNQNRFLYYVGYYDQAKR